MERPSKTPRIAKKSWRLDVKDAERPVDVDAFLWRLAEVLIELERQRSR